MVPELTRAMAIQGCALGDFVDYQEYPNDVHRSVQYTARTQFLEWFTDRFSETTRHRQLQGLVS